MSALPNVGALAFNDDQRQLMAAVDQVCQRLVTPEAERAQDGEAVRALWNALAEVGVLGLGTSEGGGSLMDAVAATMRLGAAWAPGPVIETLALAPFLSESTQAAVATGERWVALGREGRFRYAVPGAVVVDGAPNYTILEPRQVRGTGTVLGQEWFSVAGTAVEKLQDTQHINAVLEVLAAAYLVAACDTMIRKAGDYAATRVQFGKPIGSNQAVSHTLAECLNETYAVEGLTRLAAARLSRTGEAQPDSALAHLGAVRLVRRVCRRVPQIFGAVGISVEGPVSAALVRLPGIASVVSSRASASRIAASVFDGSGAQDLSVDPGLPPEVEEFRAEVAAFAATCADVRGYVRDEATRAAVKTVCQELGRRGWLSLSWPKEHGGSGKSLLYEFVLWDELAYAEVTRPPTGLGVVAKALMEHGDDAQRHEFLSQLRSGDIDIALGYSEPEAGSDLASLRTRARLDGDHYVVNGEKLWTSNGHVADYLWLLCRTGTVEARAQGLTLLLVDLPSPGISVAPINMLDGARLNEIHFDGVRVPVSRRIGAEDAAWEIISASLAVERYVQMPPKKVLADFERLVTELKSADLASDPVVRERVARLAVHIAAVAVAANAAVLAQEAGLPTAAAATHAKLLHSSASQAVADAGLDLLDLGLVNSVEMEGLWLQAFGETLGGGSTEILRTTLANLELGLAAR
jgi:alkylation response protein AidB-like acyl-CoA dehydrogenase